MDRARGNIPGTNPSPRQMKEKRFLQRNTHSQDLGRVPNILSAPGSGPAGSFLAGSQFSIFAGKMARGRCCHACWVLAIFTLGVAIPETSLQWHQILRVHASSLVQSQGGFPLRRTLRLRGAGQEGAVGSLVPGSADVATNSTRKYLGTWKDVVNSQSRVPFEIMGSPLLADEEIERIERLRRDDRGELEPAPAQSGVNYETEKELYAQPRVKTGPHGAFGPPDLTGRRWRSLESSGQSNFPYPRVALQYRVAKVQAERDCNLRTIDQQDRSTDNVRMLCDTRTHARMHARTPISCCQ